MIEVNGRTYPTVSDLLKVPEEKRVGRDYVNGVSGIFLVRNSNIRKTSNGGDFSQVIISDEKKNVGAKIWEKVESGSLVFAHYEYSSNYHSFSLTPIKIAKSEEVPSLREKLMPHFENIDRAERCLKYMIKSVKNVYLKGLLEEIFVKDEDFYASFVKSTAASRNHHVGRGGLVFHTVSMTKIALNIVSNYPKLNRDLILTGCLIHDIGKVETYHDGPDFDYTDEGKLENHVVLGIKMLTRFIDRIPNFPHELESALTHLIASHHGQLEYGSPVVPKIPEAIVVHFADELDAKLSAVFDTLEGVEKNSWSERIGIVKTDVFNFKIQ